MLTKTGRNFMPLFSPACCSITLLPAHMQLPFKEFLLQTEAEIVGRYSYMPMTLCGGILNCI